MKLIKYLFFNLYSWYYKDGNHNKSITPWFQAVAGLSIGGILWVFLFIAIYYHYVLNSFQIKIPTFVFILIVLILFSINYFLLIKDRKYEYIYIEYKHFDETGKIKGRIIAIMFIVFPGLLLLILSLVWHKMV